MILSEVPTGAIADIYSRKLSVVLGYVFMGITSMAVFFTKDYYLLIVIFGLNALSETLVSGAESAWAVNLAKGDTKLSDKYFLKRRIFRNIGLVFAPILAGFIAKSFGMPTLWLVYGSGVMISATILILIKSDKKLALKSADAIDDEDDEDEYESAAFKEVFLHLKETIKFIKNHSILSLVFLASFVFFFIEEFTSLAWTPLLQEKGLNEAAIGVIFSVIATVGIVLPLITDKLLNKLSKLQISIITTSMYALLLIVAGFVNPLFILVGIFVITYSLEEIIEPIEEALTNDFIDSKIRATALSLKSVVISLASIIGGPLAGFVMGYISLQNSILISGLLFLIIPVIYIISQKKKAL